MAQRPAQTDAAAVKTVLIVEDNELNMKLFNDLLEAHATVFCKLVRVCRRWILRGSIGLT